MQNTKHKDCFTVVIFSEKVNIFGQEFPSMKVCFRMIWRIPLTLDSPKWNDVWVLKIVCWKRDQRNKSSRPNFNPFGLFFSAINLMFFQKAKTNIMRESAPPFGYPSWRSTLIPASPWDKYPWITKISMPNGCNPIPKWILRFQPILPTNAE